MPQYEKEKHAEDDPGSYLRLGLGLLLIIIGLVLCYQVVGRVFSLAGGKQDVKIVRRQMGDTEAARTVAYPNGKAVLPESIFTVLDYGLYLGCLWLAGGMAKILLTAGAQLMQPDYKKVLQKMLAAARAPENR